MPMVAAAAVGADLSCFVALPFKQDLEEQDGFIVHVNPGFHEFRLHFGSDLSRIVPPILLHRVLAVDEQNV